MIRFSLFSGLGLLLALLISGCSTTTPKPELAQLQQQVADTERAFAKTMASRDHPGFVSFLSEETVFFSGPKPLRGKPAVADFWKRFYTDPKASFSWEPEQVEVLDSGTLALSTGPVRDPAGKHVANYSSIWRLEAPGTWRILFDQGWDVCDCKPPTANK